MNIVVLIGNVASEPVIRDTPSGKKVCTFRLAVPRVGPRDDADFFTIVTWEKTAETVQKYVDVGRRISVEGRIHHSTWQTEDDKKRSAVEVIANRVTFLGAPKKPASEPENDFQPAHNSEESHASTSDFAPIGAAESHESIMA